MKKLIFIISISIIFYIKSANAVMEVMDNLNLAQTSSMADSALQQLQTLKSVYEKTQEYVEVAKTTSKNIGQAISLGQSAASWLKADNEEVKNCLVPQISQFIPSFQAKTSGMCDSQNFIRKELGIPTTQDVENSIKQGKNDLEDWGVHDWKKGIRYNSKGEAIINLPKSIIKEKVKKRQQFANDSRQTAVAVAFSYLNNENNKLFESLNDLSSELASKPHTTNELLLVLNNNLLNIYKAILHQNALLASSIQMQAGDSLEASGLIITQGGSNE